MIGDEAAAREWLKTLPEFDALAERRTERLISLLSEENRRQNLISAASLETIWRRHVADSAQLLTYVSGDAAPWLDLGTGGGFPGLVLAILRPEMRILLVESRPQRADWLRRAFAELDLPSVEVHGEPLSRIPTEPVRVISARAFAPLDRLVALSARFSTSDTIWLLPKGRSAKQELEQLRGWRHMFHVEQSLTEPEAGVIVGKLLGRTRQNK